MTAKNVCGTSVFEPYIKLALCQRQERQEHDDDDNDNDNDDNRGIV